MKFKKVWFFGRETKDTTIDDYITRYIADNGKVIECQYGFTNASSRWYEADGKSFDTLKEAKEYIISMDKEE